MGKAFIGGNIILNAFKINSVDVRRDREGECEGGEEGKGEKVSSCKFHNLFSLYQFSRNLDMRVCRRSPNIPGKAMSSRTVLLREEGPWIVWSRSDKYWNGKSFLIWRMLPLPTEASSASSPTGLWWHQNPSGSHQRSPTRHQPPPTSSPPVRHRFQHPAWRPGPPPPHLRSDHLPCYLAISSLCCGGKLEHCIQCQLVANSPTQL